MRVGDFVTRAGSDVHQVMYLTEDGFAGEFLCIKPPVDGWIGKGETESNLARRYEPAPKKIKQIACPRCKARVQVYKAADIAACRNCGHQFDPTKKVVTL